MKENFEIESEAEDVDFTETEQEPGLKCPETANEHLDEIQGEEAKMFKEAEEALDGLTLKEFRSKPAAALLAFSLFVNASTAFAGDLKDDDFNLPDFSYDDVPVKAAKKDSNFFSSFWSKFTKKFEFSYLEQSRYLSDNPSDILSLDRNGPIVVKTAKASAFSSDTFTYEGRIESRRLFLDSLRSSSNAEEFFEGLQDMSSELSDDEKMAFLQNLGGTLGATYNYDMLENNQYVQVSNEKMFEAARAYWLDGKLIRTGICGNIHTFQTRTANALGLSSWLESGSRQDIGHVVSGIVANINGEEQIIFNDYGKMILTGTLDYSKALGVLERHLGRVGTFNTFVANDENGKNNKNILFPVKSEAQEVVEYASGMRKTETRLSRELESGKIKSEDGLKVRITPEFKEVSIDNGYVGLSHFKFKDVNNSPYQAIERMEASRFTARLKGEKLAVESNVTLVNMRLKDLYDGNIDLKELVVRLAADYIDNHSFTAKEYGDFLFSYGATLQTALRTPMEKDERDAASAMAEAGMGARLTYIPRGNSGKFYIGASEVFRGQADNFQDQEAVLKEAERTFTVGGSFKAQEASVIGLEAKKTEADWGDLLRLSGTLKRGALKAGLYHQKDDSNYGRFIPSKKEVGVGVSYKSGPKWQVDVFGAKETRQYEGSDSKDYYNTEIKFRIFLW